MSWQNKNISDVQNDKLPKSKPKFMGFKAKIKLKFWLKEEQMVTCQDHQTKY